ncbi:O-methyltransferase [Neobacillus notoginsengisoli]|uniref:tRNA 5-hydroxyuridine methyltransferase n=1 Tax=Neobacillus notoginsengisoli TaxID=1578198 RepID=A0A417YUH6_9BACI|nr:O-methyltransferase [Neobacillus notoginsengisoli]
MLNEKLQTYLDSLIPPRPSLLTEMEAFAKENNVPIMEPAGMELLLQVLRIHQPSRILEIGTAIGYSALRMAYVLPKAQIISVERDPERFSQAINNISHSEAADRIQLIQGDALETVNEAASHGPFDAIFIDAAKGQYRKFFSLYSPYLREGGIMITDNVLFKGLVYETENENRRLAKLAEKINGYNQWLIGQKDYVTTILPVGDGIAISLKRGEIHE